MTNKDQWVPACGGTETPTKYRSGHVLLYMRNPRTGEHAFLNMANDMFITTEEYLAICNC